MKKGKGLFGGVEAPCKLDPRGRVPYCMYCRQHREGYCVSGAPPLYVKASSGNVNKEG